MSRFSYLSLFPCFLLFAHFFTLSNATTFEFRNQCPYTVWAAAVPGGGQRLHPGESWTMRICMFIFLLHHLFFLFLIIFFFSKSIFQIVLSLPLLQVPPTEFLEGYKIYSEIAWNAASCAFLKLLFFYKIIFLYF
jgi:hypothetical protein